MGPLNFCRSPFFNCLPTFFNGHDRYVIVHILMEKVKCKGIYNKNEHENNLRVYINCEYVPKSPDRLRL
jgi:hypothetical protein